MTTATIVLAGNPNAGKSALFNALTGAKQKIGNYPGVTVEKKEGFLTLDQDHIAKLIDLPGIYSLNPKTVDEEIAVKVLLHQDKDFPHPDLIVAVADATNLERTLGLTLQLKEIGKPVICAVNMIDLAYRRGMRLDLRALEKELGVPVIPTIAIKKQGVKDLISAIKKNLNQPPQTSSTSHKLSSWNNFSELYAQVDEILSRVVKEPKQADLLSARLDAILLHPILGGPILAAILITMFQAVFSWAEAPMDAIEQGFNFLATLVQDYLPEGILRSFLADGIIAGLGSVLVFLPQILILFFFIFLLEGSGYMMRIAFIMDRIMAFVGLQGRSFVPLLSSFACAIPGIMATRTIKSPRDRLLTIIVAPLMTCSARLPVYVLLIGAFIPNQEVFWGLRLQGLVMFSLFIIGILSALLVSFVLKHTLLPGKRAPLIIELPSYKWPNFRYIALALWQRALIFIRRAGRIILFISVILWAVTSYPKPPQDYPHPAIEYSLAGQIGKSLEPIFKPIGFDWRIATGLIPGFAAREVMVSALATVFAVEGEDDDQGFITSLQNKISETWPLATGLSLLVWYIFAPQCLATFAVMRRETNSIKWTIIGFSYMLVLAYLGSFITFQLVSWLVNT